MRRGFLPVGRALARGQPVPTSAIHQCAAVHSVSLSIRFIPSIITCPKRTFSSSQAFSSASEPSTTPERTSLNPRWLSDIKSRIGKCIMFGLSPEQTHTAGAMLEELARDWKRLVAGSEGFLTSPDRIGLDGQRVVWGEMDCMSHVNNVTYVRYAESARIEWARNFAIRVGQGRGEGDNAQGEPVELEKRRQEWMDLWTPRGEGLILRSMRTDYKFPMTWPDQISVCHKIRNAPTGDTDSFILDVMILSHKHQRPAARCIEDIVVYDYRTNKKTNLRPFMAEEFAKTFELQEEEKKNCLSEVELLNKKVRTLEKESWDREDAKEDFGSAS